MGWDEELPSDKLEHWNNWLSSLIEVGSIVIPKCLYERGAGKILLCSLCNAALTSWAPY